MGVILLDHPLASHVLGNLRDRSTPPETFRRHCKTISLLLAIQATQDLPTVPVQVQTPIKPATCKMLSASLAAVPILRAGLGMLDAFLEAFPDVAVGYIGLERDEQTAIAHSYYCKVPSLHNKITFLLDPMLATGGSACHALSLLKENRATRIKLLSIVSAPEGVELISKRHPDVDIVTASIDDELTVQKYISPGLGDFGDRLYGTQI